MNTPRPAERPLSSPARDGRAGVTVIIPNLNGREHLPRCLESLRSTAGVDLEVVVADNGSTDGGVEWIREHHPEVEVLDLGENRGFSGALMTGVRRSSRPLVCFLNNDTEVRPDWLLHLVRAWRSDPTIAAVSATLLYMHNPEIINFGGGEMTGPGYGYQGELGRPAASLRDRPEVEDTLFASGAAMLVDRRILLECGGLDEKLHPIYHEDVDLGWRLWLLGYRVVISRRSLVLHNEGGGPGPRPGAEKIARLGLRHSVRCSIKNCELKRLFPVLGALMASQLLLGLAAAAAPARPGEPASRPAAGLIPRLAGTTRAALRVLASTLTWNLARLGDTLRQRRFIQSRRKRKDGELIRRGLIRTRPWLPLLGDYSPRRTRPPGELFPRGRLFPAEDSAIGSLGEGWGPKYSHRRRRGGTLNYHSRCRLRVAPGASGTLKVTAGLTGAARRGAVRVLVNDNISRRVELSGERIETIECAAVADGDGGLAVEIIADPIGYRRTRRTWWCLIQGIEFLPEPAAREKADVSVIIPTYNRRAYLQDCLRALTRQTLPPREVIVVDDGSTDGTREFLESLARETPLPFALRVIRQDNSGPATARNRGIEEAAGDLIAFLGDDMLAEADWLETHVANHRKRNFSGAVCGFTDWDRAGMEVTPFLEFVNLRGYQFDFAAFRPGRETPFTGFYTSNLSLPARFLKTERFDEWFRKAAFEDSEIGYRLCSRGMPIFYQPECVVRHRHPMSAGDFCRRQRMLGGLLVRLLEHRPELAPYFQIREMSRVYRPFLLRVFRPGADRVIPRLDRRKIKLPKTAYHLWLYSHLLIGVEGARDTAGR